MPLFTCGPGKNSMIALDTNVLVRVLVDEPSAPEQCKLARELVVSRSAIWISQIVLVETVWVLESVYNFDKQRILPVLEQMAQHPRFKIENSECMDMALSLYSGSAADFSDCLILSNALRHQLKLFTFDKKLGSLHGAECVSAIGRSQA